MCRKVKIRLLVLSGILCLLLPTMISCTANKAVMSAYEGVGLKDALAVKEKTKSLKSTFSIEVEKDDGNISGDAVLNLAHDSLDLRVYSLGFLVAEISSDKDFARSNPQLDAKRLSILIEGLRSCFFWWVLRDYDIEATPASYYVSNHEKALFISRKTLLPERQVIKLEDGKRINIIYEEPAFIDKEWFAKKIRIEFSGISAALKVKTLSLNN